MGKGKLIKHFLAGQAGSHYSEPQRTVHILLFKLILLYQRLLEIRVLWLEGEVGNRSARLGGIALTLTGLDVRTGGCWTCLQEANVVKRIARLTQNQTQSPNPIPDTLEAHDREHALEPDFGFWRFLTRAGAPMNINLSGGTVFAGRPVT